MHNRAVSGVDETNSVATSPIEERRVDLGSRRDELGDDETNRNSSRRFDLGCVSRRSRKVFGPGKP